jgi:hypothetical protein
VLPASSKSESEAPAAQKSEVAGPAAEKSEEQGVEKSEGAELTGNKSEGEGEWMVVGAGGKPLQQAQQEGKALIGQAAAVGGAAVTAEAPAGANE